MATSHCSSGVAGVSGGGGMRSRRREKRARTRLRLTHRVPPRTHATAGGDGGRTVSPISVAASTAAVVPAAAAAAAAAVDGGSSGSDESTAKKDELAGVGLAFYKQIYGLKVPVARLVLLRRRSDHPRSPQLVLARLYGSDHHRSALPVVRWAGIQDEERGPIW